MAPSATMLESAAYKRMRAENRSEFVPRSVVFTDDGDSDTDRDHSFWVKAALVYESITGQHVNDKTKPDAYNLLLRLAKAIHARVQQQATGAESETGPGRSSFNPKNQDGEKTSQHPDGGSKDPQQATGEAETGSGGSSVIPETHEGEKTPQHPETHEGEKTTQHPETHEWENTTQHPDEGSDENKKVIDSIFLVVGFLSMLKEASRSNSRDAVDESFKSTHMQDIVTDVIKLENQLPLKHLLEVVEYVEEVVNANEFKDQVKLKYGKYELKFKRENFHEVIHCFCWYYSPFFFNQKAAAQQIDHDGRKMEARTLLDYLHDSLLPRRFMGTGDSGDTGGKTPRMPTARELTRSGVRFDADDDGRVVVNFKEQPFRRLLLPVLVYDFKLATVARNLLAWEYEDKNKPVTRYFQMMNELVEVVADVRILRRAGVVHGGSRGAHEVHELIKKIDGYATYPSVFMAMDLQTEKVRQFHDKRMKNFLVRYRPGVIWASSVAALSVVAIVAVRKKRG